MNRSNIHLTMYICKCVIFLFNDLWDILLFPFIYNYCTSNLLALPLPIISDSLSRLYQISSYILYYLYGLTSFTILRRLC